MILRGKRVGGLYTFYAKELESDMGHSLSATPSSTRTELLHRRMGHLNIQSLRLLAQIADGIVLDSNPTTICLPCTQAKTHRRTFNNSNSHATRLGELIHTDICYIGIPTLVGVGLLGLCCSILYVS
jgi:hypothetical protein